MSDKPPEHMEMLIKILAKMQEILEQVKIIAKTEEEQLGVYTEWIEMLTKAKAKCKGCGNFIPLLALLDKQCVSCEITGKGDCVGSKKKATKKKTSKKK